MLTQDEKDLFWSIIGAAAQAYKNRSGGVREGKEVWGYDAWIEGLKELEVEASLSGDIGRALDARSTRIALQVTTAGRGVHSVTSSQRTGAVTEGDQASG